MRAQRTRSLWIYKTMMGLLLAMLSIPVQAKEADTKKGATVETASAASSEASLATPPAAAEPEAGPLPASRATPSLSQIVQLLQEQAQQIEALQTELREQQALTASLAAKLSAHPAAAQPAVDFVAPSTNELQPAGATSGLRESVGAIVDSLRQASQGQLPTNIVKAENPVSFKIGGADFTPGGFIDLTGIFRGADVGSGLGTNFTTIPYSNSLPLGGLSESRFTSQGTRLSLKVDANVGKSTAITGYIESDFNGFEPANSNISTKSDSFRLRLGFLQLRHGKWDLVAGQTWTMLTPTRIGLSPMPENIFTALRLDTSYLAGLIYDRQPGIRVVYHGANWWSFGVALENPQQFVPSSVVFPTDGATNFFSTQFDNGSSSTSAASSAVNPTVPNLHPDILAKAAFDWKVGDKLFHLDAGGVARSFRVYNNLAAPAGRDTIAGGRGGLNINFEVLKNFHLIENAFYGDGVGRYIGGLGPDVIVKPDGTLSDVHAGSGVGGFEWQATPKVLVDGYYSGAYFWRNYRATTSALGTPCGVPATSFCVGFGFPGSANTNNRDYQEATLGFVPTIWSSPNFGKLQFISQFSYVVRTPWFVPVGGPKNAHLFMSYVNLRYIIP